MKNNIFGKSDFFPYEIITIEMDIPPGIIAMQPQEVYGSILETNEGMENYEFCSELVKKREEYLKKTKI